MAARLYHRARIHHWHVCESHRKTGIKTITHDDGSLWDYAYDGRKRLTKAERYDTDGTTLLHRYTYTYDAGDNLLSKAVLDNAGPTTSTTVWAYDSANEQTAMTVDGGTAITQAYDAWGRLTSRSQGGYAATYAYRYGDKLYSVASNFPGEGNVTYETGGDQKRRSRVAGVDETWYNYDNGWNVLSEEDDADGATGALTTTNVLLTPGAEVSAILADIAGTTPSSGTPRYNTADHLGSTRGAWSGAKAAVGSYEYSPYGGEYAFTGDGLETLSASFTGKPWDADSDLYYFPYRMYSPDRARWMTRDPAGMVDGPNLYTYVRGNPVGAYDRLGLRATLCEVQAVALLMFGAYGMAAAASGAHLYILMEEAIERSENSGLPGQENGPKDAMRHCYWMCTTAVYFRPDIARTVGNAHERCQGYSEDNPHQVASRDMDYDNNEIGIGLANKARGKLGPKKWCWMYCKRALSQRILTVVNESDRAADRR